MKDRLRIVLLWLSVQGICHASPADAGRFEKMKPYFTGKVQRLESYFVDLEVGERSIDHYRRQMEDRGSVTALARCYKNALRLTIQTGSEQKVLKAPWTPWACDVFNMLTSHSDFARALVMDRMQYDPNSDSTSSEVYFLMRGRTGSYLVSWGLILDSLNSVPGIDRIAKLLMKKEEDSFARWIDAAVHQAAAGCTELLRQAEGGRNFGSRELE